MSEPLFNVVFYGLIQPDRDRATVAQNMAKLFKTTPEKLAPYFAGGRKVIKSNIDELAAEKYRVALDNIGLVIKIEEAEAVPEKPAAAATGTESNTGQAAQTDENGMSMAAVGANVIENPVEVAAQPIADISDISMAEVGANVVENPVEVAAQPIADISDISMAEVGANVVENPVEVAAQPIGDISDISMAEVGADVVENPVEVPAQPIDDISDISMAEVGADIVENPVEVPPQPIADISDLSVADAGEDITAKP